MRCPLAPTICSNSLPEIAGLFHESEVISQDESGRIDYCTSLIPKPRFGEKRLTLVREWRIRGQGHLKRGVQADSGRRRHGRQHPTAGRMRQWRRTPANRTSSSVRPRDTSGPERRQGRDGRLEDARHMAGPRFEGSRPFPSRDRSPRGPRGRHPTRPARCPLHQTQGVSLVPGRAPPLPGGGWSCPGACGGPRRLRSLLR